MRYCFLLAIGLLVGCPRSDDSVAGKPAVVATPPITAPPRVVEAPIPPSAPHGGTIVLAALTEESDAALTVDDGAQFRLWPSLDGRSPPLVVHAAEAKQVVLARDGTTLVAGVRDVAGGLELVRFDRAGRTLSRVHLAAEPTVVDIAALAGGVLALRSDQSLIWYDAHGVSRGRLVPETGTRIQAIATRRGAGIALLDNGEAPSTVRWLSVTDQLLWGKTVTLPITLVSIALAPGHGRIAGMVKDAENGVVIDLEPTPHVRVDSLNASTKIGAMDAGNTLGFIDDDRGALANRFTLGWWVPPATDPWALNATPQPSSISDTGVAIGDGLVIGGFGPTLMLITPEKVRYLGYKQLGLGTAATLGESTTLNMGGRILWLDHELHELRRTSKKDESMSVALVLDDRHLLTAAADPAAVATDDGVAPTIMMVRDVTTQTDVKVGTYHEYSGINYDPSSKVLVIYTETKADRYLVDLAKGTFTPMRPLALRTAASVHPRDPALAGGVIAVTVVHEEEASRVDTFKEPKDPSGKQVIHASTTAQFQGEVAGVDRTGTLYVLQPSEKMVVAYRDGKPRPIGKLEVPVTQGQVNAAGTAIALIAGTEILLVDTANGAIRWRIPVWRAHNVVFTGDDRAVIVSTQGGLLELDAATGHRLATGCGWGFGISDDALDVGTFGATTVCEEESR